MGEGSGSLGTPPAPCVLSGSTHRVGWEARELEEAERPPQLPTVPGPADPTSLTWRSWAISSFSSRSWGDRRGLKTQSGEEGPGERGGMWACLCHPPPPTS